MSGPWSTVYGLRSIVYGLWSMVYSTVHALLSMVCGLGGLGGLGVNVDGGRWLSEVVAENQGRGVEGWKDGGVT